jgi:predicted DNA-binding antitoxin AbrB/MazE fold protein
MGGINMTITLDAVVVNGLLKPMQPLPFKENEQVRITIQRQSIATHTSRALTVEELAQELHQASEAAAQPSVPLKHTVDYTQVF